MNNQPIFGQTSATNTSTTPSLFGATSTTTNPSQPSIFGSFGGGTAAPAASTTSAPFSFAPKPASQPTTGLFGATASSTGIFGATSTSTQAKPPAFGAFNSPAAPSAQSSFSLTPKPAASSAGIFGSTGTTGLFGATGTTGGLTASTPKPAPTSNLFGGPAPAFGAPASIQPAAPLFGAPSNTTTTAPLFGAPTNTSATSQPSVFGGLGGATSAPATSTPFSLTPKPATTSTGLFGGIGGGSATGALGTTASTLTFGAPTTTAASQSSLFGGLGGANATTTASPFSLTSKPSTQLTGGLFGTGTTTPAPISTTAAPKPTLLGTSAPATSTSFSFGSATTTATAALTLTSTVSAAPTQPTLSLFGTATSTTAPGLTLTSSTITTPKTQAPLSLFGTGTAPNATSTPAPASSTSTSSAPVSQPGLSLFSTAPTAAPTSLTPTLPTTVATSNTSASAGQLAGKMTFRDMEQVLNKLVIDYEEQDSRFQELLNEVNHKDLVLFERQQKIDNQLKEIDTLEKDHFRFGTHVEMLEEQQNEARKVIEALEKSLQLPAFNEPTQPGATSNISVDVRRHAILQLLMETDASAKQLDNEVEDLTQQLSALRQLRDSVQIGDSESGNVVDQIQTILKSQMNSIIGLEAECETLSQNLAAVSK